MIKTVSAKSLKLNRILFESICFIQVLLFVYTGLNKLFDHHNFNAQLALHFPWPFIAGFISYDIPAIELLIALLITIHRTRLIGMYSFLYLVIIFTAYIIFLLQGSSNLPCSCGGIISALTWKQHLVFNCLLIAVSIAGLHLENKLYNYAAFQKHKSG